MNTHNTSARAFIARIAVLTILIGSIVTPRNALAASSWNPTLLVNTEAFQEIDDGDGSSNIELRFGTSTQTIKFLTNGKFQLSHGLSVLGTISGSRLNIDRNATIGGTFTVSGATSLRSMLSVTTTASGNVVHAEKVLQSSGSLSVEGSASVQGNLSGRTLSVDLGATISGSLLVKNNIAAKGALSGSTIFGGGLGTCTGSDRALQYNVATGKFTCTVLSTGSFSNTGSLTTSFDKRYVNQAGDTMTGSLIIRSASGVTAVNLNVIGGVSGAFLRASGPADIHGVLSVSGAVRTDNNLTINDDQTAADAVFTFGSDGTNETLTFLNTADKFQFSDDVSVVGNISGSSLTIDNSATISGTLLVKTAITSKGSLSGSTIFGGGLGTCTGSDRALQYNVATGKFTCTVLSTGSFSNTGSLTTSFDKRYVNQAGDTMTGSLIIRSASGVTAVNLNVIGGVSGAFLRASGPADIHGVLSVSGAVRTDNNLTINDDQTAADAVFTFGSDGTNETLTFLNTADKFQFSDDLSVVGIISGSILRVDGNADIQGALNVTGSILTEGDLTLGGDDAATDVTMTFMNSGTDETLKWLDSTDKFQFSDDVSVVGNISGSSLTIDNSATISGTLLVKTSITSKGSLSGSTFYGSGLGECTTAGYGLQYNPTTGKFSCTNIASGANGSGFILSLHPEYPNAIYFASGANMVGQMTMSGGTSALDNSYVWTSSRNTIQDYWVSVRARLPNNFSSWDPVKPIEFRYKSGVASAFTNHTTIRIKDTAGVERPLTGGGNLANTSWTTATITGPESGGTWAAKDYITVYVKMATTSTGSIAAGFLNLNYESTTP